MRSSPNCHAYITIWIFRTPNYLRNVVTIDYRWCCATLLHLVHAICVARFRSLRVSQHAWANRVEHHQAHSNSWVVLRDYRNTQVFRCCHSSRFNFFVVSCQLGWFFWIQRRIGYVWNELPENLRISIISSNYSAIWNVPDDVQPIAPSCAGYSGMIESCHTNGVNQMATKLRSTHRYQLSRRFRK